MTETMSLETLAATLQPLGLADDAAEYHGALCGALCVRAPGEIDVLNLIEATRPGAAGDAARAALEALRTATFESLSDEGLGFEPILPDDDTALVPRVGSLVAWCEGFLYGLASKPGLKLERCSDDLQEIVRDLADLTQAAVGESDPNIEETAYAELVEYVRVGAQLVFMELHPRPTLDPTESNQLH